MPQDTHPSSVVLIVVDTLRADHLGAYGYPRTTSATLDLWAADGVLFERAVASAPWTLPSFASIYTGLPPSRHEAGIVLDRTPGSKRFARLAESVQTLAELLTENGFATHAIVTNPWLGQAFGIARGFEAYDYSTSANHPTRGSRRTVAAALEWLDSRDDRPFLLVLHFMDPHMAYEPAEEVRGRFTRAHAGSLELPVRNTEKLRSLAADIAEVDRRFIAAAYDEEVLSVDRQLGRLFEGFEQRGLLEDTLIVLTSDHGEELFDHASFEHGHTVYQELLHVPLVIAGSGVAPGRRDTLVSHVDLLPTMLEALGLAVPAGLAGVSLWATLSRGSPVPDRTIFAEGTLYGRERRAAIRWPWKAIVTVGEESPQLFDLAADPGERRNLAREHPETLAALVSAIVEQSAPAGTGVSAQLDQATRLQLRELGYVE